ncbi:hypothetical protein F4781DRAFT_398100 [Annulohypoxylon bovei var. microspora]|nr:hypothetical protein F4781DRAFT_398100 [Annulohypoxylon bovei var. microspora]
MDGRIGIYLLAIWLGRKLSIIPVRVMIVLIVLLCGASGVLARPTHPVADSVAYPLILEGLVELCSSTGNAQNSDSLVLQSKTYYLTVTGTVFTALGVCLSLIGTSMAVIEFRQRMKDRVTNEASREMVHSHNQANMRQLLAEELVLLLSQSLSESRYRRIDFAVASGVSSDVVSGMSNRTIRIQDVGDIPLTTSRHPPYRSANRGQQ